MTDYPWQPGPWSIGNYGTVDANGKSVFRDPCGPNLAIEVLAPQMAEAILQHECTRAGHEVAGPKGCLDPLCALAEEIRKIQSQDW